MISVTIYGETQNGVPGTPGRTLVHAVDEALGPERHHVKLETARRA